MKPSLIRISPGNGPGSCCRSCWTADMSTSLNVVSKAACCWACTSRSAMRRRMRVIGTTSSCRGAARPWIAAEAGDSAAFPRVPAEPRAQRLRQAPRPAWPKPRPPGPCSTNCSTSSFSRRPLGPVAGTSRAWSPCSWSRRWAAGMMTSGLGNGPGRLSAAGAVGRRGRVVDQGDGLADLGRLAVSLENPGQDSRRRAPASPCWPCPFPVRQAFRRARPIGLPA